MVFEYDKNSKEKMPYEYYISEFAKANPIEISNRLAVPYDTKERRFLFPFLTNNYYFSWPDLTVISKTQEEAYNPFEKSVFTKVLVLRYLLYATPLLPNGEFRSFRELPSGDLYYRQFQGRCIFRLIRKYSSRLEIFRKVMETLNATPIHVGDVAYEIELFENLYIQFILWEGDEEFQPSAQILFSSNFPAAFGTYDLAEIGDICINTFSEVEKTIEKERN